MTRKEVLKEIKKIVEQVARRELNSEGGMVLIGDLMNQLESNLD